MKDKICIKVTDHYLDGNSTRNLTKKTIVYLKNFLVGWQILMKN